MTCKLFINTSIVIWIFHLECVACGLYSKSNSTMSYILWLDFIEHDNCSGVSVIHHDDVIKWKHFPRNWPFVREIHRSPVNFPHKGQWRGALMFSLIYAWINVWVNNREAGDLRRQHGHYDVIVMTSRQMSPIVAVMGACVEMKTWRFR